jgi:hypothetical protein
MTLYLAMNIFYLVFSNAKNNSHENEFNIQPSLSLLWFYKFLQRIKLSDRLNILLISAFFVLGFQPQNSAFEFRKKYHSLKK